MAQSEFRPGRSLIAVGGPGSLALAPGVPTVFTLQVREAGQLGQAVVACTDPAPAPAGAYDMTNSCSITEITHNNDLLISTNVSAAMFNETSLISPLFGHIVQVNDELTITVLNNSTATALIGEVSFSTI
jgi:hypothetical protein